MRHQAMILDDAENDPLEHYKLLYEKMRRGLNQKHIELGEITKYSITDPGIVRGHITCSIGDYDSELPARSHHRWPRSYLG